MGSLHKPKQAWKFLHEHAVANRSDARGAAEVTELPLFLDLCNNDSSSARSGVLTAVAARFLLPLRIEATWGADDRRVKSWCSNASKGRPRS